MKKRLISAVPRSDPDPTEPEWLPLTEIAEVEISSEADNHPIEAALEIDGEMGWRADEAGEQTIRLRFERASAVKRVRVVFEERDRARTQQFSLRAKEASGGWREIARQQFNFSPSGATREVEDYQVNLAGVEVLELTIVPDISGGDARASLQQFRVA